MSPERWQQIERVWFAALECDEAQRAAFLDQFCAGDDSLRREVESLLGYRKQAENFIEAPAMLAAAELLAQETMPDEIQPQPTKPESKAPRSRPRFYYLVIALCGLAGLYFLFVCALAVRYGAQAKDFGWQYEARGQQWLVSTVDAPGVAAGRLQPGDQILAINGDAWIVRVGADLNLRLTHDLLPPGSCYTINIARAGRTERIELSVPLAGSSGWWGIAAGLLVSFSFYIFALVVGVMKPEQHAARLAFAAGLSIAVDAMTGALFPVEPFLQGPIRAVYFLAGADVLAFAIAYHFISCFPPGIVAGRGTRWLRRLIYLAAIIQFVPRFFLRALTAAGEPIVRAVWSGHQSELMAWVRFDGVLYAALTVLVAAAVTATLIGHYRRVSEPGQRRRIKWVVYGIALALVPVLLFFVVFVIRALAGSAYVPSGRSFAVLIQLINLPAVAIPVTFGAAILRHRLFDINVVVRRGVQYLLARNVLRVILLLPLVGLGVAIFRQRHQTVGELLFHNSIYFYLIVLASCGLRFRGQLSAWIDRRFFREAWDQERILLALIDEIRAAETMPEISRLVSRELEAALHPASIHVFYRAGDANELTLGYSSDGAQQLRIPESYQLLRLMAGESGALDSGALRRSGLPDDEQHWLDALGVQLLVPVCGASGLLAGLLALGARKSEQPYSPRDRQLLQAIAGQIGVVLENLRLRQRVEQEQKIRREVLARLGDEQVSLLKECPVCGLCYDAAAQLCRADQHELTLTLPVERTIEGRYRLEQLLGRGGMGAVYRAQDLRLQRQVAVKIITGSLFGDARAVRRFEREARAAARLSHPNIVTVYDSGSLGAGAYLVMELLPGTTLRAELKRRGRIEPRTAAGWFEQILAGVAAAHAGGIIHRDLKPENILITATGQGDQLRILDFGLAKLIEARNAECTMRNEEGTETLWSSAADTPHSALRTPHFTTPGLVMGTPGYMSPEQLTGGAVDERSDIFSLGVIVAEALTGQRPFAGRTQAELLLAIRRQALQLNDDDAAMSRLNVVLQQSLAADPARRFASVDEFRQALMPALNAAIQPGQ
ncbi:MAG: protein kinase [Blastocatellia bacterium]